jgi:hypothetical protein
MRGQPYSARNPAASTLCVLQAGIDCLRPGNGLVAAIPQRANCLFHGAIMRPRLVARLSWGAHACRSGPVRAVVDNSVNH